MTIADLKALIANVLDNPGTEAVAQITSPLDVSDINFIPPGLYLDFLPPGKFIRQSGTVPLLIQGEIRAFASSQIFDLEGQFWLANFNKQEYAHIGWWGAKADGNLYGIGTDNTAAFNAATLALASWGSGPKLKLLNGTYVLKGIWSVVNNPANNHRRSLWVEGGAGRQIDDNNAGTFLVWAGDSTSPMVNWHTRNGKLGGIIYAAAVNYPLDTAVDVDIPPNEPNDQILTANEFFNGGVDGQYGPVSNGFVMGKSNIMNDEHNSWRGMSFLNFRRAALDFRSGNGQSKFNQIWDCAFDNSGFTDQTGYGILTAIASWHVHDSTFTNLLVIAQGNSYESCSINNCDAESCLQAVNGPGIRTMKIVSSRLAANKVPGPNKPAMGKEFIYGVYQLSIDSTDFEDQNAGFAIRPANGGIITVNNVLFNTDMPFTKDGLSSWSGNMTGIRLNGKPFSGTMSDHYGVADFNIPTNLLLGGGKINFDGLQNVYRVIAAGGFPREVVTTQSINYVLVNAGIFLPGQGNVPPPTPELVGQSYWWNWCVSYVGPQGESPMVLFVKQNYTSQTGGILLPVPLGPAGTTARKIYRGTKYFDPTTFGLVGTIPNNTDLTWIDTAATLGAPPPSQPPQGLISRGIASFSKSPSLVGVD